MGEHFGGAEVNTLRISLSASGFCVYDANVPSLKSSNLLSGAVECADLCSSGQQERTVAPTATGSFIFSYCRTFVSLHAYKSNDDHPLYQAPNSISTLKGMHMDTKGSSQSPQNPATWFPREKIQHNSACCL